MLSYQEKQQLKKEVAATWELITNPQTREELLELLSYRKLEDSYQNYGPLYNHGTEDMRTYYEHFNSVEDILTIGASGDQILNAVNMGAKRIDVFDKNILSKRGVSLKIAASKTVSKEDLLEYFHSLDEELYQFIRTELGEADKAYWDSVYEIADSKDISRNLFPYRNLNRFLIEKINPYLDDENYELLKEKLQDVEINFIDSKLESIYQHINGRKYDAINFSNVPEYLNMGESSRADDARAFHDYVMSYIYPHLKDGGKIMLAYMYAFSESVRKFIMESYKQDPDGIIKSGAVRLSNIEKYLMGLTDQNVGYGLLLEEFKNDPIERIVTEHIVYGQSQDMEHDMAIMLRK